jgi:hypothetical protein
LPFYENNSDRKLSNLISPLNQKTTCNECYIVAHLTDICFKSFCYPFTHQPGPWHETGNDLIFFFAWFSRAVYHTTMLYFEGNVHFEFLLMKVDKGRRRFYGHKPIPTYDSNNERTYQVWHASLPVERGLTAGSQKTTFTN